MRQNKSLARRASLSYEAASDGARLRSWLTGSGDGNTEIQAGLPKMQQRSRQLVRDEWRARAAVRALVRSIVGAGIRPIPLIGDQTKARVIKDAWSDHVMEGRTSSDGTLYTTMAQAFNACVVDGEVFLRARPRRPDDGLLVPVQWQIIESDMLDVSFNQDLGNGRRIVQSIELDLVGRRLAYHVWKRHPGDTSALGMEGAAERVRVPAAEVAHLWNQTEARPGQVRGAPWLHAIIVAMRETGVTEDALRVALQHAAMFSAVIETPENDIKDFLPADPLGDDGTTGLEMSELVPGMATRINPGERIQFANVQAPNGVTEYLRQGDHGIAAGIGTTYEDMTGDLSRVNFSSARMGRSNSRAWYREIRETVVIPMMCMPMWRWFVRLGKINGVIPLDYNENRVRWIAPVEEGIDPVKDQAASTARMAAGVSTLEDEIERLGDDYYATIDNAQRVKDDLAERGLSYEWASQPDSTEPPEVTD